jgi:hypothetical protein
LNLAYARTIHKFQGLTAGPVDKGKIPNMYECIICDPDKKQFEASALGLFYTALSRATTLGDDDGLNSAIYFTGDNFTEERIRNLCYKTGTYQQFDKAIHRKKWVSYLNHRTNETSKWVNQYIPNPEKYLKWGETIRIDKNELRSITDEYIRQLYLVSYNKYA